LKDETFVRGPDDVVPGYTEKIIRFCRQFGEFRPRLVTLDGAASLAERLALAANEDAFSLNRKVMHGAAEIFKSQVQSVRQRGMVNRSIPELDDYSSIYAS
jgi:hypothetical protein